jgi:hypothetical protein
MLAVAAVRTVVSSATSDHDLITAEQRFSDVAQMLPHGQVRLDMDLAAMYLARANNDAATGHDTGGDVRQFAGALAKISKDCREG